MTETDFPDTMVMPRRQSPPMDFRPASYEAAHAASEIDDDASEALRKKVRGARFGFAALLVSAAIFIAGIAALASLY